jgi:hypothetical protein
MDRTLGSERLEVADNRTLREVRINFPDSRFYAHLPKA